jgi:hypothetical protein
VPLFQLKKSPRNPRVERVLSRRDGASLTSSRCAAFEMVGNRSRVAGVLPMPSDIGETLSTCLVVPNVQRFWQVTCPIGQVLNENGQVTCPATGR